MSVVLLEPGRSRTSATSSPLAKEDAVPRPVTVLLCVELDEIGSDVLGLADEDADGEHRVRDGQRRVRSPRALGQHEPGQVGAGFRGRDVLLPGQAADLDERPAQEVAKLAAGSGARMRAEPTRTASAPASSAAAPWARLWTPLSATIMRSRERGATSSSWARRSMSKVERSRAFRPITSAPIAGCALKLLYVVRLDEHVQAKLLRDGHELQPGVVEVAKQEQGGVGACLAASARCSRSGEEPFGQQR